MTKRPSDFVRQPSASRLDILGGFDALADIYGHVPPLIIWRAWEYAVYRRYKLREPVLDLGCGDGRFFRRVFPGLGDVIGVDEDDAVVSLARESDVYRAVHLAPAHRIPVPDGVFGSAFANCSLEHMSHLDDVLSEVYRTLKPGGTFLLSVVTDTFVRWAPLQALLTAAGVPDTGASVQARHVAYHHLVNPLPLEGWVSRLTRAGFQPLEWVPIIEGAAGWTFLLLDQLWHLQDGEREYGDHMHGTLMATPRSVEASRLIFDGLLTMSAGATDHAGVVVWLEKVPFDSR